MKKLILLITLLLTVVATTFAQINQYPNTSGTITKSGYTYKYRNGTISGIEQTRRIDLYNASSTYLDMKWAHKDGTDLAQGEALGWYRDPYYFSYSSMTLEQLRSLVAGCFTSQQKATLKASESTMVVTVRLDPVTGRVADVYFSFRRSLPLSNVPVETFRSIELAIKQKLTITSTDAGRRFNYCEFIWQQVF